MAKKFEVNGKKYRLTDGLLVDELEVKEGARYQHVAYVRGEEDAMNVIHDRPRKLEEYGDFDE